MLCSISSLLSGLSYEPRVIGKTGNYALKESCPEIVISENRRSLLPGKDVRLERHAEVFRASRKIYLLKFGCNIIGLGSRTVVVSRGPVRNLRALL